MNNTSRVLGNSPSERHKDTHLPSLLGFLDLFQGDTEGPTQPLTPTTHIQHVTMYHKQKKVDTNTSYESTLLFSSHRLIVR